MLFTHAAPMRVQHDSHLIPSFCPPPRSRFSVQHEVGLPSASQRAAILRSYLRRHQREVRGLKWGCALFVGFL